MSMQAKLYSELPLPDTALRWPMDGLATGLWYNRTVNAGIPDGSVSAFPGRRCRLRQALVVET